VLYKVRLPIYFRKTLLQRFDLETFHSEGDTLIQDIPCPLCEEWYPECYRCPVGGDCTDLIDRLIIRPAVGDIAWGNYFEFSKKQIKVFSHLGQNIIKHIHDFLEIEVEWTTDCPKCGKHLTSLDVYQTAAIAVVTFDEVLRWDINDDLPNPWFVCPHCGVELTDDEDEARLLLGGDGHGA